MSHILILHVAKKPKNVRKLIFLHILFLLVISCNSRDKRSNETNAERIITLQGQNNFRDLGNYSTTDGETLKSGKVYRSGTLSRLTEDDKAIIESLGIKTVVNFLTEEEITKRGADKLPESVTSVHLPISGDNDEVLIALKARQTGDFSDVPVELNFNIHKLLPEAGKDSYYQLFKLLADSSNYPVVIHCSHGVHRTGTASALLLSLLDVPWSQIESDYLISNKSREHESTRRIHQLDSMARQNFDNLDYEKNRENIEAFYILKREYIQGTKSYIEETYGSFDKYFEDLGLSENDILNIKQILIEK